MKEEKEIQTKVGKRTDYEFKESFLESGRISLKKAFWLGIESLGNDPLLLLIRYLPGPLGIKMRQIYYKRRLGYMGKGVIIDPGVELLPPKNIYIDNFSYIGSGTRIYSPEGYVHIGKRCHITGWILGHGGVEIDNYVGCGGKIISISDSHDGGHRMSGPMIPLAQRNLKKGKITIEKDAFIGQESMVMPGVTVGEGAVIGPFSYVFRNIKPWTIVLGNPARKIGEREKVRFPDPDSD